MKNSSILVIYKPLIGPHSFLWVIPRLVSRMAGIVDFIILKRVRVFWRKILSIDHGIGAET